MKLSDVSPLAAMLTGEGGLGKLISQGVGGAIPAMIARQARKSDEEEEEEKKRRGEMQVPEEGTGMKKGGVTKMKKGGMTASKRADGCAQRGKTRGKMV